MGLRSDTDDIMRLTAAALEKAMAASLDPDGQHHLACALEAFRRDAALRNLTALEAMRHRPPRA